MKITEVRLGLISVPLRVPFKTALRSVSSVEDVIVEIHTDTGAVGYGEAPPTGVITGDTTGAIIGAIRDHIAKTIIGRDVDDFEDLMIALNACIQKNTSAKAAVDMALWDLYGQLYKIPVYKLMGGAKKSIVTDITISVNDPEEMVRDALNPALWVMGWMGNSFEWRGNEMAASEVKVAVKVWPSTSKDCSVTRARIATASMAPCRLSAPGRGCGASATGSATEGIVTAVCTPIHSGRSLAVHEIVITAEDGRRCSTVRITNFYKPIK